MVSDTAQTLVPTWFCSTEHRCPTTRRLEWLQGLSPLRVSRCDGRTELFQRRLNCAFVVNPTISTTGIGVLGAAGKSFVGNQVYDGNAPGGDLAIDIFDEGEWLKVVGAGRGPAIDRRKADQIQFTYWNKNDREKAGVPKGSGWAISTSWKVSDKALPDLQYIKGAAKNPTANSIWVVGLRAILTL